MELIDFCDKYCPMPSRWVEFPKVDNELTTDCDLEESDCPFKDVDFTKVCVAELDERATAAALTPKTDDEGLVPFPKKDPHYFEGNEQDVAEYWWDLATRNQQAADQDAELGRINRWETSAREELKAEFATRLAEDVKLAVKAERDRCIHLIYVYGEGKLEALEARISEPE